MKKDQRGHMATQTAATAATNAAAKDGLVQRRRIHRRREKRLLH